MSRFPTFEQFHRDVTGHNPFPWQSRLAEHVREQGWPGRIAVPTGLGKTTSVMVAVHELARQVQFGKIRIQPLRMVHVVDRRSIVDQTELIFDRIHEAFTGESGPAATVGQALSGHFGKALVHSKLYAGVKDTDWIRPDVPTLLSMTSHQFVSRLLFRGFGVSAGMAPIHAGLLGVDCLVLFDEPHLSVPAITTILSAQQLQAQAPDNDRLGVPPAILTVLGATLPPVELDLPGGIVEVGPDDHEHPVSGQRLRATRQLALQQIAMATDNAYITAIVKTALQHRADGAEHIGIMVNDIALARGVHDKLLGASGAHGTGGFEAMLVTSRMRPVDRRGVDARIAAGDLSAFTVATQTLEAGVDVSFDALVTEACPLPSLIQRIGRLNRQGEATSAQAILLYTANGKVRKATNAVYGEAPVTTTTQLLTQVADGAERIPFSPAALATLHTAHPEAVAACWPAQRPSATLHAGWSRIFTQTRPLPAVDIPIEAFIAGRIPQDQDSPEVRVAWREDISSEALEAMPPLPDEIVSVPLHAVRSFLTGGRAVPVSDTADPTLRGAKTPNLPTGVGPLHQCVQLKDDEWTVLKRPRDLTPGLLVLHTTRGGYDEHGWNPDSTAAVTDHGVRLHLQAGYQALITEHTPGVPEHWWDTLDQLAEAGEHLDQALAYLQDGVGGFTAVDLTLGQAPSGRSITVRLSGQQQTDTKPTGLVGLDEHARHVAGLARRSAERLGASDPVIAAAEWAGYLHDAGKARDEFQRLLGATPGGPVLAKSALTDPDQALASRARRLSGLEPGWRHEAASAIRASEKGASDEVVHLVASHHGWARPLMIPEGPEHTRAGDATRFRRLNDHHGPWGLAWMEALVRLADHEASNTPEPNWAAPTTRMPTQQATSDGGRRVSIPMRGLRVQSPAEWWATFGVLAAAQTARPGSRVRFEHRVPILETPDHGDEPAQDTLQGICEHLLQTLRRWATHHGRATAQPFAAVFKNQKWDGKNPSVFHGLGDLAGLMRSTYADVTDPGDNTLESIGPWWPHQSTRWHYVFEQSAQTGAESLYQATQAVTADQFHPVSCGGLTEAWEDRTTEHGIAHRSRVDLLLMVAYGIGTHGLNNGTDFLGTLTTTTERRATLPLPGRAVDTDTLAALMQSIPRTRTRNWSSMHVPQALTARVKYQESGKKRMWTDEAIIALDGASLAHTRSGRRGP